MFTASYRQTRFLYYFEILAEWPLCYSELEISMLFSS
jgi:hypothetical protein